MKIEKRKKKRKEENYQIKKKSERTEKRKLTNTWQYWKRAPLNMRGWNGKKRKSQMNEKTTQNQTRQQESHQRAFSFIIYSGTFLKSIRELQQMDQWLKLKENENK